MPIELDCPCGRKLTVADEHAGRQGTCPACGKNLDIPDPSLPAPWPAPGLRESAPAPRPTWVADPPAAADPPNTLFPWAPPPADPPRPPRSKWPPAIIILVLVGIVAFGVIRFGGFWPESGHGTRLAFTDKEEIYYRGVSEDEARRLGQGLKELGVFNHTSRKTVQLTRRDGRYAVSFVIQGGAWHDEDQCDSVWFTCLKLSARVFNGQPVEVRLCDEHLRERVTLRPGDAGLGAWLSVSPREDLFYKGITEQQAREVAEHLKQMKEFDGQMERALVVARSAAGVRFTIFVQSGMSNNPELVAAARLLGLELSAQLFNDEPVEVCLWGEGPSEKRCDKAGPDSLGKWLSLGPREDLYYRGLTEAEARKLGEYLKRSGYFAGGGGGLVAAARGPDGLRLTFPVPEGDWDNPVRIREFRDYGRHLCSEVFGDERAEVRQADVQLRVKNTVRLP